MVFHYHQMSCDMVFLSHQMSCDMVFQSQQMSCDSSTPEAEDRTRFKRYFQILPNDIHLSKAFVQILNIFNWTKLHAINLDFGLFVQVCVCGGGTTTVCVSDAHVPLAFGGGVGGAKGWDVGGANGCGVEGALNVELVAIV